MRTLHQRIGMDDSPKRTACRNVGPYSVFVSQTDILSDELKKAQAEKKKLVQLAKQNAQDILMMSLFEQFVNDAG